MLPYTAEELESSLAMDRRYGDFLLTDAVAISSNSDTKIKPESGFCFSMREGISCIIACVSAEIIFDLFWDFIDMAGSPVNVMLKRRIKKEHYRLFFREGIDLPVLKSMLLDFQNILCNDGLSVIAVIDMSESVKICLDDHKIFFLWSESDEDADNFFRILSAYKIQKKDKVNSILDADHFHLTFPEFRSQFDELVCRIGADE